MAHANVMLVSKSGFGGRRKRSDEECKHNKNLMAAHLMYPQFYTEFPSFVVSI
jgi:hypothetical protein